MRVALRIALVVCVGRLFWRVWWLRAGPMTSKTPATSPRTGGLRDGFETPEPIWESEHTDTVIRLLEHDRSQRAAHGGRLSEHFHFESGPGSQFFVSYAHAEDPGVR